MWTTPEETFRERNLKVVETYLYHHPDAEINIYATHLSSKPFENLINAGYTINILTLTDQILMDWTSECPGRKWVERLDEWKKGRYYYSHITDFIRFCVLYREGGIYSDFDALLLQPINEFETFIGKDSSSGNGKCEWCLAGGDLYLAPGLMGARKGHHLPYQALKVGFESNYDPEIFNLVGPMAVTKAFKHNSRGIHIYDRNAFYPYPWNQAVLTFKPQSQHLQKLDRLRRKSLSLHFYGHTSRDAEVQAGSMVDAVYEEFSVVKKEPVGRFSLKAPAFLGIQNSAEIIGDLRIVWPGQEAPFNKDLEFVVTLSSPHGRLVSRTSNQALSDPIRAKGILEITTTTIREMNSRLSRIIYLPDHNVDKRDTIYVEFSVKSNSFQQKPQQLKIRVYVVSNLVTIIVKTMGRMEKVFNTLETARRYYPTISIIVSDDADNLKQTEGMYRGFYYLPMPYDVGLSAGRNQMVDRVRTEYFLTLDDDFLFDETSRIDYLLHALEESKFDVAAAKNPIDEEKFGFDYCGIMTVKDRALYLSEGEYQEIHGCQHVDFVPNIFVGRTETFHKKIRWDEALKLGEHEDFFLRGKHAGIKVLTCPAVGFIHDQVEHWLRKTPYDRMRSRVFDFWKTSLKKHALTKLVSFGRTVMDLERTSNFISWRPVSSF